MRVGRTLPAELAAAGAALLLTAAAASAYRLYAAVDTLVPTSGQALRRDAAEWGAGRTLTWTIARDSGWTKEWEDDEGETSPPPFAGASDARPALAKALAAWASLGSADIRWRVGETAAVEPIDADGRNAIGVEATEPGVLAWAAVWARWEPADGWEIEECDIVLAPVSAAELAVGEPDGTATLIHELGHCIGLDHAAETGFWAGLFDRESGVWGESPKMSYGFVLTDALLPDDIVGASLLRPVAGWRDRVGSLSGRVTLAGEPARFVPVRSARLAGGETVPAPAVFTDERGRFTIEGLAPGEYLLAAGPFTSGWAHRDLLDGGALLDAADGVLLEPVTVRAGRRTTGAALVLSPGREGSGFVR